MLIHKVKYCVFHSSVLLCGVEESKEGHKRLYLISQDYKFAHCLKGFLNRYSSLVLFVVYGFVCAKKNIFHKIYFKPTKKLANCPIFEI